MDKVEKKRIRNQYRDQQRKAALEALPLTLPQLKDLFDMLDVEFPKQGCNHTRRLTEAWLKQRGHNVESVFEWLDTLNGFCDCGILANVEQHVEEAAKAGA